MKAIIFFKASIKIKQNTFCILIQSVIMAKTIYQIQYTKKEEKRKKMIKMQNNSSN